MDIKLDDKPEKPPREGDDRLGIPQSRVEGAWIRTDTKGEDHPRQRDGKSRHESEKEPKGDVKSTIAAPDNGPGKSLREGDDGLGIPQSHTEGARALTDEEIEKHKHQQEEELRREFERKIEELGAAGTSFNIPAGVLRVVIWIGWSVASVLGLFLVAQGAALVDDIRVLPTPFNWIAGVSASAFATILIALILKLGVMLARLHRSPTIPLQSLAALQQRERWRQLAKQHLERAKRELQDYLKGYEPGGDTRKRLRVFGVSEDQYAKLVEARKFLLGDAPLSPDEWLKEFSLRFQSILDAAAERRVKSYAMKVGVTTAATPVAVIDQLIVLYSCVALTKELMTIYGLRPAFGQTATLLARSIVTTYLSGLAQELSEGGVDTVFDTFTQFQGELATGPLVQGITAKIGIAKVAEGTFNYTLIRRLGKRTISLLQPVRPEG